METSTVLLLSKPYTVLFSPLKTNSKILSCQHIQPHLMTLLAWVMLGRPRSLFRGEVEALEQQEDERSLKAKNDAVQALTGHKVAAD